MTRTLIYVGIVLAAVLIFRISRSESAKDFGRDLGRIVANWILRSPARLGLSVLGVLVLLAVLAVFTRSPATKPHAAPPVSPISLYDTPSVPVVGTPTGTPTLAGPQTNITEPGPTPTVTRPKQVMVDPHILDVAFKFAHGWIYHPTGITTAIWLIGIAPYTTPGLLAQLHDANPTMIPVNALTGPPRLGVTADGQAQVTVPGDPYPVDLVVKRSTAGVWLVDSVNVTGV